MKIAFIERAAGSIPAMACAAFFLCCVSPATGQGAGMGAEEIVRRLEANQVTNTARCDARFSVTNRFGVTASEFTSWSRKGGDTLVEIASGPDRGQKILRQGANIYLFYPDAEEVIWLKGSALKDSIMGSDFSYEDLTNDKTLADRFDSVLVGTEKIDGIDCYRLMLTAKSRAEAYAKEELWVDAALFVTRRALLYSAAGKPIRELTASDIHPVGGKNFAFRTVMKDLLKKGTSTEMTVVKAEFDIPVSDRYFNREELSW
jgi:outer membrane lipoprotein-sorting protein